MLNTQDTRRLQVESFCDLRTIRRAYDGEPITLASRARLRKAAELLNLPMPPEPTSRHRGVEE